MHQTFNYEAGFVRNLLFQDVLEQTMQQLQLGGLLDLHRMYKDKVLNYHNNVKSNAIQLTNHYNMLVTRQQQNAAAQLHPAPSVHPQQPTTA